MNNTINFRIKFIILLFIVFYSIVITSSINERFPSLFFPYLVLESFIIIHVFNILKNKKININDLIGLNYFYQMYPSLQHKSLRILRILLFIFIGYIFIIPILTITFQQNIDIYLLLFPFIPLGYFCSVYKIKEWKGILKNN